MEVSIVGSDSQIVNFFLFLKIQLKLIESMEIFTVVHQKNVAHLCVWSMLCVHQVHNYKSPFFICCFVQITNKNINKRASWLLVNSVSNIDLTHCSSLNGEIDLNLYSNTNNTNSKVIHVIRSQWRLNKICLSFFSSSHEVSFIYLNRSIYYFVLLLFFLSASVQ